MKIFVKARAGVKTEKVSRNDANHFSVWVKVPAREGRANEAVLRLLAEYLQLPCSALQIKSGFSSRDKIIEIT